MPEPGRGCRAGYGYGPSFLAGMPETEAAVLYVIGGLYGNLPALEAVLNLAEREPVPPVLAFNGDFNWFNVDDAGFESVNRLVLGHDATLGNVEAELGAPDDRVGCGCAYPSRVDAALVARSNRIHARLRETAGRHQNILERLAGLPMARRYRIGTRAVCVLHGDSESLAGWGFDESALREPAREAWLRGQFDRARADIFASSHTCLPALRVVDRAGVVINNGAAGMPNFRKRLHGLITRIGAMPSPTRPVYGMQCQDAHIDALAVEYDRQRWQAAFLDNWPEGSPAHVSYFRRISEGTDYAMDRAFIHR